MVYRNFLYINHWSRNARNLYMQTVRICYIQRPPPLYPFTSLNCVNIKVSAPSNKTMWNCVPKNMHTHTMAACVCVCVCVGGHGSNECAGHAYIYNIYIRTCVCVQVGHRYKSRLGCKVIFATGRTLDNGNNQ